MLYFISEYNQELLTSVIAKNHDTKFYLPLFNELRVRTSHLRDSISKTFHENSGHMTGIEISSRFYEKLGDKIISDYGFRKKEFAFVATSGLIQVSIQLKESYDYHKADDEIDYLVKNYINDSSFMKTAIDKEMGRRIEEDEYFTYLKKDYALIDGFICLVITGTLPYKITITKDDVDLAINNIEKIILK